MTSRVIVLDASVLDCTLALGVKPVGAATIEGRSDFPTYLGSFTEGTQPVGMTSEPDLNMVARLKPDLIVISKSKHEAISEALNQLAPTVFVESAGAAWKENLELLGRRLGQTEALSRVLDGYLRDTKHLRQKIRGALGTLQVSVLRSFPNHVRIYLRKSFIGTILDDSGVVCSKGYSSEQFAVRANMARLTKLDSDAIFLLYYNRDKGEQLSTLIHHPLWPKLKAARNGRVYIADDDVWGLGLGTSSTTK